LHRRGMSIRTKMIGVSTALMVGVIGLFSAMHTVNHLRIIDESSRRAQDSLEQRLRSAGMAQLRLMVDVTRLALLQNDFATLQTIAHNLSREEGIVAVAVVDRRGMVLAHSEPDHAGRRASGLLQRVLGGGEADGGRRRRASPDRAELDGVRVMTFVETVRAPDSAGVPMGTVFLASSLRPLEAEFAAAARTRKAELERGLRRTVEVGLVALLVGVFLTVLQSLRLSRPIQRLARQVDKMAVGDLTARVPVTSGDEIGRLAERFNHMAGQMQQLVQEAITKATMEKELELAEASRLAAVGRLAAGVAHEVNNPLTYAKGNLQMLAQELSGDEDLLELTREALHGVSRIQSVVRELSEFAQSRQTNLPGRVHEAVESAAKMAMVQLKDRARLELEIPELPQVTMEESKLAQVLLNLLVNSAQVIPGGAVDENLVHVLARLDHEHVEIVVQDSGPGIPPEVLPHVFESFFTTKQVGQGYGLGLSVSRSMVAASGGAISASNTAQGARFTIRLPVHQAGPAPRLHEQPVETTPVSLPSGPRRTMLLVDDETQVLQSLERMLSRDFLVTTALSGSEALELLVQHGKRYDVVLCDVMMPQKSGLDVADTLLLEAPHQLSRLILMTGGTPGIESDALACLSGVQWLGKPFELAELLQLVRPAGGDPT